MTPAKKLAFLDAYGSNICFRFAKDAAVAKAYAEEKKRILEHYDISVSAMKKNYSKWNTPETKEEWKELVRQGLGDVVQAVVRKSKSTAATGVPLDMTKQLFARNMLQSVTYGKLVQHLSSADALLYSAKKGHHINGGVKIPLVMRNDSCNYKGEPSLFSNMMTDTYSGTDINEDIEGYISGDIKSYLKRNCNKVLPEFPVGKDYLLETGEVIQQQEGSCVEPGVVHSDLHNAIQSVRGDSTRVQGLVMLTPNSKGTIVYDMEGVPHNPTLLDVVNEFARMIPPPAGCYDLADLFSCCHLEDLMATWGQLLFANDARRGEKKIVPQYSVQLLAGSHPHCGPGVVKGAGPRMVLFFTAAVEGTKSKPYQDEQMTREKLMGHIIQKCLPPLVGPKSNRDYITIIYLSSIWAEYICNSSSHNSYDATAIEELGSNGFKQGFLRLYKELCSHSLCYYNLEAKCSSSTKAKAAQKTKLDNIRKAFEVHFMAHDVRYNK